MPEAHDLLRQWTDFYVIVGSSAGALTGLQFVVIALIREAQLGGSILEIRAFGTPTVVHFCVALLVSGIICAPWHAISSVAICLALCGAGGVVYAGRVIRHARAQSGYSPDLEDWFWYTVLPTSAYTLLFTAAIALWWHPASMLFVVAGTALLLVFVGIHNAWDTVTYVAIRRNEKVG